MKIVADDKIPGLKGVFEPFAEVLYLPGKDIGPDDVKDADALIVRTRTACNAQLLESSSVKMVATATIGTDHFDIPWLESAGIRWVNAPGCNSGSVRQYIGSVLARLILEGRDPATTTLGIVGVGMVGSKIAQLANALGFKVLLNDPPRQRSEGSAAFCDLPQLLQESDLISFHTPLNMSGPDATWHLFNKDTLRQTKKGAIVINTSRGEVTATQTLLQGLASAHLSRVVLDVWENEPNIHSDLHQKVWIGTPHIAGYSVDGKANGTTMTVQALARHFQLPLSDWQPASLPLPPDPLIRFGEEILQMTPAQVAATAILKTFDVCDDDARLRARPTEFEKLRGAYPPRREFHLWQVQLPARASREVRTLFKQLCFQLKEAQ